MQNPIAVEYHERGEVRPTLVVGLGGSGVYTARRLKQLIRERYSVEGLIRFIYLDTDQGQFQQEPTLADVESDEIVQLSIAHPEQIVDEWKRNPELHPYLEFLNGDVDVGLLRNADGAAGIRPVGRFGFHASFDRIYPRLQQAVRQIMQVEEQVRALMATVRYRVEVLSSQPRIYIIASLCGGTGSGIYFDTALVLREILLQQNLDGELVGIFYLPSVFQNEAGISRSMREVIEANAYAALMELEYFCNSKNLNRETWEVKYRMIAPIAIKEPLVDEAYVVESANAGGRTLGSKYEVFEMVARSLLMDIGSPLGARARSAKRNSLAVIDAIPCPETRQPRLLASLAVASVAVPIRELTEYCCLRLLLDRLQTGYDAGHYHNWSDEAENFMQANGITVQSLQSELSEVRRAFRIGEQESPERAIERAKRQEQELVANINALAARKRHEIVSRVREALQKRCEALESKHGGAGVVQFLEALRQRVQEESNSAQSQMKQVESENTDTWERMQQDATASPGFLSLFSSTRARQQRDQQLEARVNRRLERTVSALRLQKVAEILGADTDSITSVLREIHKQYASNTQTTQELVSLLRERLQEIEELRPGTAYPLELLACLRHHFRNFYQAKKQTLSAAVRDIRIEGLSARDKTALDRLVQKIAEQINEPIRNEANVMEFLKHVYDERAGEDVDDRVYLERKVAYLLEVARPFWSAVQPPGDARFEEFVAVSVPLSPEDYQKAEEAKRLDDAVAQITRLAGVSCERVPDGYPFALTVMNRTYGARAYYLRSIHNMEHIYRMRANNSQVRAHLHLDARFTQLPMLTPPDPEAERLWAAAIHLGCVALIDGKFYYGVEDEGHATPRPKYQTQREPRLRLPDENGNDLLTGIYHRANSESSIGETYRAARQAFLNDRKRQREVESFLARLEDSVGRERLAAALETLAEQLRDTANQTPDPEAQQWSEERENIRVLVQQIRERKHVLSHNGRRDW
ncbi:MAG: tubulin-like doman-containing protein [Fimbriimonadales bacterium]|nr:MAG: hypothetical protein KatS3mg018_0758 [Fimbriimonadales bacterium]